VLAISLDDLRSDPADRPAARRAVSLGSVREAQLVDAALAE